MKTVTYYLEEKLLSKLESYSKKTYLKKSVVVALALEEYFKKRGEDDNEKGD